MTRKQQFYCLKIQKFAYRMITLCLIINAFVAQWQAPFNLLFIIFDIYILIFMVIDDTWYFWVHKDEMQTVGKYRRFDRLVMSISFFYALLINLLYWNCVVYSWYHFNGK